MLLQLRLLQQRRSRAVRAVVSPPRRGGVRRAMGAAAVVDLEPQPQNCRLPPPQLPHSTEQQHCHCRTVRRVGCVGALPQRQQPQQPQHSSSTPTHPKSLFAVASHLSSQGRKMASLLSSLALSTTLQQQQPLNCKQFSTTTSSTTPSSSSNNNNSNNNTIPFLLADIGEGIKEVELLQWFVQPGDAVQQFDKICEVQSDKATVEITSRYDGTVVHLPYQIGDLCPVGQPLLYLRSNDDNDHPPDKQRSSSTTAPASTAVDETAPPDSTLGRVLSNTTPQQQQRLVDPNDTAAAHSTTPRLSIPTIARQFRLAGDDDDDRLHNKNHRNHPGLRTSPAVRKLGRDYQLDLSTLQGRGPHGRLLKHDVVTFLKEQGLWQGGGGSSSSNDDDETAAATTIPKDGSLWAPSPSQQQQQATTEMTMDEEPIIALRGYQRMMAKSMTAALQTPHMGFADEVVCNALLECRRQLNAELSNGQVKISLLALLIQAVSASLRQFPQLNAVVVPSDDSNNQWQYQIRRDHNIGIAMDTPRGLVVPVIAQCQRLSLLELQRELDRLKQLANAPEAKFTETDLSPPTFTLSNIGSLGHGGTYMQPVLAPPALCLGALGSLQRLPRFVELDNDNNNNNSSSSSLQVYAAQIMTVSWCADHRFIDGATLARFHGQFRHYVQHPLQLWLQQMSPPPPQNR